jgi:hypothetical protein
LWLLRTPLFVPYVRWKLTIWSIHERQSHGYFVAMNYFKPCSTIGLWGCETISLWNYSIAISLWVF